MIKKIIEIISNVTCRECGAIYGYDEHDEMIKKAAEDIVKLKIIPRCEDETNAEVWDKAPLIIHQRFCHELVYIAKKHEKQKMDEVPEFMDMLKAIEILENLYPKLNKK